MPINFALSAVINHINQMGNVFRTTCSLNIFVVVLKSCNRESHSVFQHILFINVTTTFILKVLK